MTTNPHFDPLEVLKKHEKTIEQLATFFRDRNISPMTAHLLCNIFAELSLDYIHAKIKTQ